MNGNLSKQAKLYILGSILLGGGLAVWQLSQLQTRAVELLVLAVLASVAQVLKVEGKTHKTSYNISWLVYGFTFVHLGSPSTFFVILFSHLVEWIWHRYPWYIQSFNIASFSVTVLGAGMAYRWVNPGGDAYSQMGILGIFVALVAFTFLNHLLIGLVIWVARGQNFNKSGVFGMMTLMMDLTVIGLGAATAILWTVNVFATLFTLIPLYLLYSTLKVPSLQRQSEVDPKTGLYNARHFANALNKELERAQRFDRPLTVVLGDLDLLRNINNTYGHLAGDVVLKGIADMLQKSFRDYDLVARFGGEEFAILMPETSPDQAYPRVEAVRKAIEAIEFDVSTSITPIKATMSFGVAARDHFDQSAEDIVHNADVALYDAKLSGRNLTFVHNNYDMEEFFGLKEQQENQETESPIPAPRERLEGRVYDFQPNPLRQYTTIPPTKEEPVRTQRRKSLPNWTLNAYIGLLALVALGLTKLLLRPDVAIDWIGLGVFAALVAITEGMSVDIYAQDRSVSTSSAPLVAGILLFGVTGALILGVVTAATAMVKFRSPFKRFVFNSSNHLITNYLAVKLLFLLGYHPGASYSFPVLSGFAIVTATIVFLGSTVTLSGLLSILKVQPLRRIWTANFQWLWPYYLAFGAIAFTLILGYQFASVLGVLAIVIPVLTLRYSQALYIDRTRNVVTQLRKTNTELERKSSEISILNEELLMSLASAIDLRDAFTMGHSKSVAKYAVMLAERIGLKEAQIVRLRKAALLHDIGKIGVPDAILFKKSSLTEEEYDLVKQHPILGAEIIQANHSLQNLVPIIRHHHERYDGNGYPDRLRGREIPIEARIVGLADAVEAMASDRPYRKGMSLEAIQRELTINAGTQFDPEIAAAFLEILEEKGEALIKNTGYEIKMELKYMPALSYALGD